MKVIRIKHCIYCPHCEGLAVASFYCKRLGRLPLNNTIPSNCPLEDDTPTSHTETVKEILTVATDPDRKWEGMGKKKRR